MRTIARIGLVGLVMAAGLVCTEAREAAASTAAQPRSALQLRKHKYRLDDSGHIWMAVQLQNVGTRHVRVKAIAVSRWGPWTMLDKDVAPDEVCRGSVKVGGDRPAALWVDSSEGLLRFDMPSAR